MMSNVDPDSWSAEDENLYQPDAWGLHRWWVDADEQPQAVPEETIRELREVIGRPPEDLEQRAPVVTRPGRDPGLGRVEIQCEDGTTRTVDGAIPADFPHGYHVVNAPYGGRRRLIVSPGRCWLPEDWRAWGWTAQLYATRSRQSWGIGDLADLRTMRTWSESIGAGFLLVNPLHAVAPTDEQEDSPYLPATRRFRNPLYVRVEEVPGAEHVDLASLAERGRELNSAGRIDRDAIWALKRDALWRIFAASDAEDRGFTAWRARQGQALEDFATWCALTEVHGGDSGSWPEEFRRTDTRAVARFATTHAQRVRFHAWLQWLLERQLQDATGGLPVIQDLPIGASGGGADAWTWQHVLAEGVTIGAPPDAFNATGQDWGSPPLVPWRLRLADYEPFIQVVRSTMASAGGIRIDHVMGLFRLWWVPAGRSAREGAYVRYPSQDLLDIVALESQRAQAIVVGEDLGTVEPGVREELAERAMLSYRLLWFEDEDPAEWPTDALAAVTTHDLPTVSGLWTGSDLAEQSRFTQQPTAELESGREELLTRLRGRSGLAPAATPEQAVAAAHRLIARAPCTLLSATLEDAVEADRRPNMPGTTERDNWCLPLPVMIEDLPDHPTVRQVAAALGHHGHEPKASRNR